MINQYLPHGQATPFVPHPDNWKALYQAGLNSTSNVAINGGGENSSFRVSYSYTDNNGVFSRSIGPDDGRQLALRNAQADVVQHRGAAVGPAQVFSFNHGFAALSLWPCAPTDR